MIGKMDKVGLFVPCCIDQFAADSAWKAIKLLEGLKLQCLYPSSLTCCGKELYNQGDRESARELGEKMIEQYDECRYVVCLGSGCVAYMQRCFARLFHNTTFHNSYRQFLDKCFELSDFLVNIMHYEAAGVKFQHRVAVMDHCTTQRDYSSPAHPDRKGLAEEPRKLLQGVDGLTLVEMAQQDVCCGFGGMFANNFTPIADSLTKRKIDNALAVGAEYLTCTEPSCLMHLQAYADKASVGIKCLNIIDILVAEQ